MSDELLARIAALEAENEQLRRQARAKERLATRALASYQHRALQMEIIRQQNEDLERIANDLAQSKDFARKIEEAARLKSEFLANFSHEIRTPLNGIIGYCDLLAQEEGDRLTAHGRKDLTTIKANAKTLLALINDILDLSKIEAGHAEIVREHVDTEALVHECAATVRELLKGKDVALRVRVEPRAARAFTDPLKLRQIVLNLLSNAVKFTDCGEVSVAVRARGDALVVEVEDTGVGIPPDQLAVIFEKFRQVDGTRTRRAGGTGLGLAIVRELARVLGGAVAVKSTLGRGSTFTVELTGAVESNPAAEPVPAGAPARDSRPAPAAAPAPARARSVLVVDDDPMVLALFRGALEREGIKVLTASDGVDGLRQARLHRPQAIVLDIRLPDLDGWSVMSVLKADPELAAIPVVIVSIEEQRARGYALGAVDYLVKPLDVDSLVEVVERAMNAAGGNVLVVDDDVELLGVVERQLRNAGLSPITAADARQALALLRSHRPALMILDLLMPEMDGFQLLMEIRRAGIDTPVLVLTGRDLSHGDRARLREGLASVIQKGGDALDVVVAEAKRHILQRGAVAVVRAPRVLYVEDIAQNRDIVRRYLGADFEVIEAVDGEAGLQRAAHDRPELILMDLSLPNLDGWEATRQLKLDPATAHIPVIAITGHVTAEDRQRAQAVGCDAFLTKPIARDELLATMRAHMSRRRAHGGP
jgi:CheY-like chemotaxis protein/signal transduction histidine kinase